MRTGTKVLLGVGAAIVAVGVGAGFALTGDSESPITGVALERASSAALEHTGEGRVTDTEVGDEESLYEVEVTLDDGTQVDVQLDAGFQVVGQEVDGPGDDD